VERGQRPTDLQRSHSFVATNRAALVHDPVIKAAPDGLV
jgi:hypothetical protein